MNIHLGPKGNRKAREHARAELIKRGREITNKPQVEIKPEIKEEVVESVKPPVEIAVRMEDPIVEKKVEEVEIEEGEKESKITIINSENPTESDYLTESIYLRSMTVEELLELKPAVKRKRLFVEFFNKTLGSIQATCDKIGIHKDTYYDWRKNDREFFEACQSASMTAQEMAYQQLAKAILEGDMPSVRYFLDRRHPDFMPRLKIATSPNPGEKSLEEELADIEIID